VSKEGIYCFWCKKWYSNSHFTKHLNKQGICPNKIVIEKQLENVFHIYTGVDPVLLEFEKVKPTKMKSVAEIESEIEETNKNWNAEGLSSMNRKYLQGRLNALYWVIASDYITYQKKWEALLSKVKCQREFNDNSMKNYSDEKGRVLDEIIKFMESFP